MIKKNVTTIRPGLLVGLKSIVTGGVSYMRLDLEHTADTKVGDVARWETTRVITDPAEYERAVKTRGKALAEIRSCCSSTAFGLLCPTDREDDLDAAILRARALVEDFNISAAFSRVAIYVLKGRIAENDAEAARAIGEEVASLINEMSVGIEKLDPETIRDAANRARQMAALLGDTEQATVTGAIEQARKAARTIVKRIQKEGDDAAVVLKDIQRGEIERARIAFLDLSDEQVTVETSPVVEAQRFADLDLGKEGSN